MVIYFIQIKSFFAKVSEIMLMFLIIQSGLNYVVECFCLFAEIPILVFIRLMTLCFLTEILNTDKILNMIVG